MANREQSHVEWAQQNIAGSFADAGQVADKLRAAAEHCHLVGGASVCPLIEGHEVQLTVVPINIAECYPIRGQDGAAAKKGIPKSTLMQLAAAAGVEWFYSKRQDAGKDPHYCHWKVKGRYRQIDGTFREVEGDRDVDNREGSDQLRGKSEKEAQMLRVNTLRSAITKAKLRALREAFGVSQGLPEDELRRPFVFARSIFTGRSSDPMIRRMFAQVIAQQQLTATSALYGGSPAPQRIGSAPAPMGLLSAGGPMVDIDPEDDGELVDEQGEVYDAPPPPPQAATRPARSDASSQARPAIYLPGKKDAPKVRIVDAEDRNLAFWEERIAKALDSGESRYPDQERATLAAIRAEIAKRDGGAPGPKGQDQDDDDIPY